MSVTQIARAYEYAADHELAPPRRLVLYVMADASDDDGRLWHGQQRLKRLTGLSVSTIRLAIREFEEAGILSTEARSRDAGRGRTSNLYTLNLLPPGNSDKSSEQPPSVGGGPRRETADQPPGDGGPIDRRTVREPSVGIECAEVADFSILPAAVAAPLRQVADAKAGKLDPAAIKRALDAYPDRDHFEEAEKFAAWHTTGNGENASARDLAAGFRNWLKRAPAVEPGRRQKPADPPPVVALEVVQGGLAEADAIWPWVLNRLFDTVPGGTFGLWLAPLAPAGADSSTVFLEAPDGIRSWAERRYSGLIREALADVGFDREISFDPITVRSEAA